MSLTILSTTPYFTIKQSSTTDLKIPQKITLLKIEIALPLNYVPTVIVPTYFKNHQFHEIKEFRQSMIVSLFVNLIDVNLNIFSPHFRKY